MKRTMLRQFLTVGALVLALFSVTATANAGWHHWPYFAGGYGDPILGWTGYNYGYYAGWSGGCGVNCCDYGCYRPAYVPAYSCGSTWCAPCYRGCGVLGRVAYRWRTHHYAYYWGGCCAPAWTLPGCCSVCGQTDCGCGAVDGDVLYSAPTVAPDNQQVAPTPAAPDQGQPTPAEPTPGAEKQTGLPLNGALLNVSVPANARVLVNGIATRSTGELRRYVSRNLTPGFSYTYEVTAEAMINGQTVSQSKTVQLRAGEEAAVAFNMAADQPVETALTLHVPTDAKVFLAGNETSGEGSVRTFRTTKLNGSREWSQYVVRVSVLRGGQEVTKQESITLHAGDQAEMTFDFDADKVADAR
jgi:uncharacterized protein (TIGR03000 family)